MQTFIFKNANIFYNPEATPFNWLLTQNGRIIALGHKTDPIPKIEIDQKIDLKQKYVLPAWGDAHLHSLWAARLFLEIDLSPARSLQQALNILKKAKNSFKPEQWVIGRGFNKNMWQDGQPDRQSLDRLFPRNPVYLESQDCHAAWVNSAAIKRIGLTKTAVDPPGGKFSRNANGEFSGLVFDKAMEIFKKVLPPPSEEQLLNALDRFVKQLLKNGVTHIHTMEGAEALNLWQKYFKRFGRKMRVVFYFPVDEMENLIQAGLHSGFGDEWLRIGGIKIFTDGSLGSQTAALRQPYENQTDNSGLLMYNESELLKIVTRAQQHHLAVAIHAIGDKAVEMVLKVLKQTEDLRKQNRLISRLEHAQLVTPDLIPLFKQFGVVASMQPIHIADDVKTAETFWGQRSRFAYPIRSLLSHGITLAFGSDAPVAEANPLKGIFSAVWRKFKFDLTEPSWNPQESISVWQAFQAFSKGVANAAMADTFLGELSPGKLADFIVLDRSPFNADPANFKKLHIEKTILNGNIVFNHPGKSAYLKRPHFLE